jgi:hypothetical protein
VLLPWLAGQDAAPPGQAWGWRARGAWEAFLRQRRERHAQVAQWPQAPYWRRRRASFQFFAGTERKPVRAEPFDELRTGSVEASGAAGQQALRQAQGERVIS